jgi:thymidylate synthase ThyX
MGFSKEDEAILNNHITSIDKDIYVIYNLPPEVVAVLFAYVSRSPASFRENLLKLIKSKDIDMGEVVRLYCEKGVDYKEAKEKARKFHEQWVVGYGHSSVAEHAIASIAVENVSILATKTIEDSRLASYTEKSTRYQIFEKGKYYKPLRLMNSQLGEDYRKACDHLFTLYLEVMPKLLKHMKGHFPKESGMTDAAYEAVTKARACDVARHILPASTLTNLAITINARSLERMLTKLLSDPLDEMHDIGTGMKQEVIKIIPTLVKYADHNLYIAETNRSMEALLSDFRGINTGRKEGQNVHLVEYDRDAENKILASIIYRYTHEPYASIIEKVRRMEDEERQRIFEDYMRRMGRHDPPMRELEHVYYTFDILCDYGVFRDIQRQRICTQTNQALTTTNGYDVPKEIAEIGYEKEFRHAMELAATAFEKITATFPKEAQYVIPLAYRKRTLFTWNLRELYHFVKLRSSKEGHIAYRKIAWDVYNEVKRVHPLLAKYMQIDPEEGPSR